MKIAFFVPVAPAPKGSFRAFQSARSRRIVVTNDNKRTKEFQDAVAVMARGAANRVRLAGPATGPVSLSLVFTLPRPAKAVGVWERKPDLDKLTRSVLDGLTGVFYVDDQQVDVLEASKRFQSVGEEPGVDVVAVLP